MKLLYSNILPLELEGNQVTVSECVIQQISKSKSIYIAVGYVSKASLEELNLQISTHNISRITLVMGMYYIEGMPEGIYHTAMAINKKWQESGIGEIRVTEAFKYHGKTYVFHQSDGTSSAIIGSSNLGVIKPEASNRRQYETACFTDCPEECREIASFIHKLLDDRCSSNIADVPSIPLIRETNNALTGIELVQKVPQAEVDIYKNHRTEVSFQLPIKVPAYSERHIDDGRHFTKSNLNVCYAAPRSARKSRDWYETQLTVSKAITLLPGYPKKNVPFFVVTDDGYIFKAHTTSAQNKQFSAVGDELILGRWIKGRLAAAGLASPVNDTQLDRDRLGMITKEMLAAYGCSQLILTKTYNKVADTSGNLLDVWFLSFEAAREIN